MYGDVSDEGVGDGLDDVVFEEPLHPSLHVRFLYIQSTSLSSSTNILLKNMPNVLVNTTDQYWIYR